MKNKRELSIELPYNPAIPGLEIYPREMKTCLIQHGDYSQ